MNNPLKVSETIRLPSERQLAGMLCLWNDITPVDPIDGSENWWAFGDIARAMLAGVTGGRVEDSARVERRLEEGRDGKA
jgi:hypothetical protein